MIIRYLKQKFRPRRTDDAGNAIPRTWIGDQEEAVLVDLGSGKVYALAWHDGYGKYYATVYVSPLRALRLSRNNEGFLVSLLPLPRCAVELLTLTLGCMEDARTVAKFALQGRI
jgi:hypothetical protein